VARAENHSERCGHPASHSIKRDLSLNRRELFRKIPAYHAHLLATARALRSSTRRFHGTSRRSIDPLCLASLCAALDLRYAPVTLVGHPGLRTCQSAENPMHSRQREDG
jgi:hypothetical protein